MPYVAVLAVLLAASACAQEAAAPSAVDDSARLRRADSVVAPRTPGMATDTLRLAIGETAVTVLVHTAPGPAATGAAGDGPPVARLDALSLHDDENTAVDAALSVLRRRGGRVVELQHTGERHLSFALGGERFAVDPNRIFTDAGRARTLAALSRDTPAARAAAASFADTLLALYTATGPNPVVTLHNNTPGQYSAQSYRPGAEYARDASAVHLPDHHDPDDFFFVTGAPLYQRLRDAGLAVVQQNDATATDDGSLSVWAARVGVPYVNVEAQHGHLEQQAAMIDRLAELLIP